VHWPVLTEQTQQPPSMTLAGVNAKHPWLDSRMCIVGYEPITSYRTWISSNTKLGTAVHEVVTYLQVNPPEIVEITDAGLRSIQQPKTAGQMDLQNKSTGLIHGSEDLYSSNPIRTNTIRSNNPNTNSGVGKPSVYSHGEPPKYDSVRPNTKVVSPDIELPTIPTQFIEINKLNKDELQNLLDDEAKFMKFCNGLPVVQTYGQMLHSVIDENAVIAKHNLSKQEELQSLYEECNSLEKELTKSIQNFQMLEEKQNAYCLQPDAKLVLKELTSAKKIAFDESEDIARRWLDNVNTMSVDDFLETFVAKRKLHHERAAKLELLQATRSSGLR
jgi:Modifier of rudimentary (Mod(r)) protein